MNKSVMYSRYFLILGYNCLHMFHVKLLTYSAILALLIFLIFSSLFKKK